MRLPRRRAASGPKPRPPTQAAPHLDLKVDELHLHGFSSAEREVLLVALERELSRIIAERGLPGAAPCPDGAPAEPLHVDRVRIDCARAHHPGDAGREAARILYAKLCLASQTGAGS